MKLKGNIYHYTQIKFAYNTNRIEGSRLSEEETRFIFETNTLETVTFKEIVEFHYRFEKIHSFQDGNGRVGRALMFKECLKNNIVPFIIEDSFKAFYYRGLLNYEEEKGFLEESCLAMQDNYKGVIKKF